MSDPNEDTLMKFLAFAVLAFAFALEKYTLWGEPQRPRALLLLAVVVTAWRRCCTIMIAA
jgi:hypothetical protein